MKHIYLSWEQNSLEEEFVEQEDETVQYEYEEEAPTRNLSVRIGWVPNTDFDGVDTKPLFDDI